MALIEMDFAGSGGSGFNLDPSNIFKATVNANSAGTPISVVNGKTYLVEQFAKENYDYFYSINFEFDKEPLIYKY